MIREGALGSMAVADSVLIPEERLKALGTVDDVSASSSAGGPFGMVAPSGSWPGANAASVARVFTSVVANPLPAVAQRTAGSAARLHEPPARFRPTSVRRR